jgi:hypothetical protein
MLCVLHKLNGVIFVIQTSYGTDFDSSRAKRLSPLLLFRVFPNAVIDVVVVFGVL